MKVRLPVDEKKPTSMVTLADIDAAVERVLDRANYDTLPVNIHLLREIVGVGASAPSGSGNSGNSGKQTGMPRQKTPGAAGWDLRYIPPPDFKAMDARPDKAVANPAVGVSALGVVTLYQGGNALLPTGIRIAVPNGFEAQIRPRSSLAAKGLIITNSPGTIDSDYRGEVKVLMTMTQAGPVTIKPGDSIAQIVFTPIYEPEFKECTATDFDELKTERGAGGFGSTGA
jgi:dUTP pyrophosphatase